MLACRLQRISMMSNAIQRYVLLNALALLLACSGCKEGKHGDESPLQASSECQFPSVLQYSVPGCGDDVKPHCVPGAGAAGACASLPACGCDGRVFTGGCGVASHGFGAKYQFRYTEFTAASSACEPAPGYDGGMD
jgi:hypothetical protein